MYYLVIISFTLSQALPQRGSGEGAYFSTFFPFTMLMPFCIPAMR